MSMEPEGWFMDAGPPSWDTEAKTFSFFLRKPGREPVMCILAMDALENAGRQSAAIYRECVLYTTLSPCSMCSGAILLYGIPRVVIGENRTFMGEEDLLRSRGVSLEVVQSDECIRMMEEFIRKNSRLWDEDIGV